MDVNGHHNAWFLHIWVWALLAHNRTMYGNSLMVYEHMPWSVRCDKAQIFSDKTEVSSIKVNVSLKCCVIVKQFCTAVTSVITVKLFSLNNALMWNLVLLFQHHDKGKGTQFKVWYIPYMTYWLPSLAYLTPLGGRIHCITQTQFSSTRYPSLVSSLRQYGMISLSNPSAHMGIEP